LLFVAKGLGLTVVSNLFVCKIAHLFFNTVETYVSLKNLSILILFVLYR
jgi:hypothetical protein